MFDASSLLADAGIAAELAPDSTTIAELPSGISVEEIYQVLRKGKKVAVIFDNFSQASDWAIRIQHHLQVLKTRDKKLTETFLSWNNFTIAFDLTNLDGERVGMLQRVVFYPGQSPETVRFAKFEVLE